MFYVLPIGNMINMFTAREGMPSNMELYVNIQRQFFESFVGQTFKEFIYVLLRLFRQTN